MDARSLRLFAARALTSASLGLFSVAGCAAPLEPTDAVDDSQEPYLALQSGGSVEDAVRNSCGTASVRGLSEQLMAQMNCSVPNALVAVGHPRIRAEQTPYLQPEAASSLIASLDARPGTVMTVNSAFRTAAQQYLLYRWGQERRCNINVVATPGSSNHQSGLAIDIEDPQGWRPTLESRGFRWYGSSDPMHFDYTRGNDLRGLSIFAFQQIWNLNHPEDRIAEDGQYGPATGERIRRSPAGGFPRGPSCGSANEHGCTMGEEEACARFGTQCADHRCSGGFGEGHGCTAREEQNCANFGTQCVDHQCSGGFGEGHGCTAREEQNCANFGTQCVDHQCSGGFGPGTGCTAREEQNCAAFGMHCVDHQCSGGFGQGTGCTAREQVDCQARGQGCRDHRCTQG